jgi:ketosteroid isomerase-like protein
VYSWLVGLLVRRVFAHLSEGNPRPALRMFAPDARFIFHGDSSFGADLTDKAEIEAWFARFAAFSPSFEIHDVLVSGPPWNMRVATRFTDHLPMPDGDGVLHNPGMQYLRMRWGRVKEDRIYIDTQLVAEFDRRIGT